MTMKEQEEPKQKAVRQFSEALANLLEAFTPLASHIYCRKIPRHPQQRPLPTRKALSRCGPT